ncbi:hydroxyacylglutathione hydrolase-like protein isoform X2 [Perca flavescens]|uniref:hydroxyacylglutathione hydrolase-like protein isoform X2 n=1 Tax=Perca flavescens TaxID=8167 RepID=UPI00106EA4A3|nr:hydroxyacylglutathione hydrolase-like protein isoform X2 [Perca flavescens]
MSDKLSVAHSGAHAFNGAMKVKVISILEDNYMYLVIEEQSKQAVAVDPAVPHRLLEIVKREGLSLTAVLTTHHHWDHARGNEALLKEVPGLRVYGGDDRIGGLTDKVTDAQELKFNSINVRCLFTPCHTSGHMCYFVWEDECTDAPAVFTGLCNHKELGNQLKPVKYISEHSAYLYSTLCGDTLFISGCGRFLEGTAEQMYHNLTQVLGSLPQDTKVFCGHEYTIKNLKFAMLVEPENEKVKEMLSWARARDDDDKPTVPSTLMEEFEYNPFLRLSEEGVQKFTGKTDPIEVLRVLRKERDTFKKPKQRLPPHAMLALEWGLLRP